MRRHSDNSNRCDYYDLRVIFHLRDIIAALDPSSPPTATLVHSPTGGVPERLGVLAGSFNPLTVAHVALAQRARHAAHLPAIFLLLSKVTVDKERAGGALLEDRLLVLKRYAAKHRGLGLLLVNRGLYVEQAAALHRAFPALRALYFVVGFDKILQIFDPRYYADRDAALGQLFSLASFLVAPRDGSDRADLAKLLQRPENRPFRDLVTLLPFPRSLATLSSTWVRKALTAGLELASDPLATAVPREVAAFIGATDAYQPPERLPDGEVIDRYALRAALVALLDRDRPRLDDVQVDFPRLLKLAWGNTAAGRELRQLLRHPPAEIRRALQRMLPST